MWYIEFFIDGMNVLEISRAAPAFGARLLGCIEWVAKKLKR